MPLIVPLQPLPSQTVGVQLNGQDCQIAIYQKFFALFLDLIVAGTPIITGAICLNANLIVRQLYLGFDGDLAFIDNQGSLNPYYTGLGDRYSLCYLFPEDLATLAHPLFPEEA
jgi:hypothetical protein